MTFSPIIGAAGAVPDSAATVPGPAIAPDSGTVPSQAAEPAIEACQAGSAAGQADPAAGHAGRGDYAAGHADTASGQVAYSADQGAYSTGQSGYSAEYADTAADSGQADEAGAAWPHQTYLELGALPTAAPCARLHTTLVLWEWELGTLVSTAGLVVSELVSNAVQASAGLTGSQFAGQWAPGTPPVRVWLSADDRRVVIQVWDGSDRPPVPQPVEPEADCGRGLLLVGALSAEWGCYAPEKSSGKVVWAVVTG